MDNRKTIVVTAYGQNKGINKIAVSYFDVFEDANTYCKIINSIELNGDYWIYAKTLSENTQYKLNVFIPLNFSDVIIKLDNRAVQKVLKEVDSYEIAKSLKDQDENVREKIFINMSKRASKMLKEDMEVMGSITINDIKETQEKILIVIQYLEEIGEIIIPHCKGETTE
jgi:flagellar motor switch protein FliG